jgi:hypothetical protein
MGGEGKGKAWSGEGWHVVGKVSCAIEGRGQSERGSGSGFEARGRGSEKGARRDELGK